MHKASFLALGFIISTIGVGAQELSELKEGYYLQFKQGFVMVNVAPDGTLFETAERTDVVGMNNEGNYTGVSLDRDVFGNMAFRYIEIALTGDVVAQSGVLYSERTVVDIVGGMVRLTRYVLKPIPEGLLIRREMVLRNKDDKGSPSDSHSYFNDYFKYVSPALRQSAP